VTAPRDYACLCFDSSYILAEVLENNDAKTKLGIINDYQKNLKLDVYVSPTVKAECNQRIVALVSRVGDLIRDFEHYFRIKKSAIGSSVISFDDTRFVREFFYAECAKYKRTDSEVELLKRIESWIVRFMWEKLQLGQSIKYFEFMTTIMVEILKQGNFIRDKFDNFSSKIRTTNSAIDPALLNKLQQDPAMKNTAIKKPNDLQILCEVAAHQRDIHKWSLLVTLDERDFLNNSLQIDKLSNVKCVDPLYIPEVVRSLRSASRP